MGIEAAGQLWNFEWDIQKLFAATASLVTILGGAYTLYWRYQTAETRRLKLISQYVDDRRIEIAKHRQAALRRIENSQFREQEGKEPDVSATMKQVVELIEQYEITAAYDRLLLLESELEAKAEFINKYATELKKDQADLSLLLAALSDRRNDTPRGLHYISKAKEFLASDSDVLRYEGLLRLKEENWIGAHDIFLQLENISRGSDTRHYKAMGAEGRGDALKGMGHFSEALQAYGLVHSRMTQAKAGFKDFVAVGRVYRKIAEIHNTESAPRNQGAARDAIIRSIELLQSCDRQLAARELLTSKELKVRLS